MNLGYLERKEKKGWRCRNDPDWLLPVFGFGSRHRFSLSQQSFLALCCDMVPRLWGWLGRDKGFLGCNIIVSYWFSVTTRALPMSPQCFILCRDDVMIKGPLSRPRRLRQEVRVRQKFGWGQGILGCDRKLVVSRQDLMG